MLQIMKNLGAYLYLIIHYSIFLNMILKYNLAIIFQFIVISWKIILIPKFTIINLTKKLMVRYMFMFDKMEMVLA